MKNVKYGKCVRCGKTYDAVPDLFSQERIARLSLP